MMIITYCIFLVATRWHYDSDKILTHTHLHIWNLENLYLRYIISDPATSDPTAAITTSFHSQFNNTEIFKLNSPKIMLIKLNLWEEFVTRPENGKNIGNITNLNQNG